MLRDPFIRDTLWAGAVVFGLCWAVALVVSLTRIELSTAPQASTDGSLGLRGTFDPTFVALGKPSVCSMRTVGP
jgi:hypothetical protein